MGRLLLTICFLVANTSQSDRLIVGDDKSCTYCVRKLGHLTPPIGQNKPEQSVVAVKKLFLRHLQVLRGKVFGVSVFTTDQTSCRGNDEERLERL